MRLEILKSLKSATPNPKFTGSHEKSVKNLLKLKLKINLEEL